jgi:hypothetical protein
LDADGNEVAGIRLPDVSVPVGTHTGWNLRAPETGAPEQTAPFVGFTSFFAPTRAVREATGDPRPSLAERYASREDYAALAERYASREDYAAQARAGADQLVQEGYLLAEDTELVLKSALRRFDATGEGSV